MDTVFDKDQVRSVIESVGVRVVTQTMTDYLCFCPFHSNYDSPAFTVGIENGLYMCHNPVCTANNGGNIHKLVMLLGKKNILEARRFILGRRVDMRPLSEYVEEMYEPKEMKRIPYGVVDKMVSNLNQSPRALEYLKSRGFTEETIQNFKTGYDPKIDMIVVPIFDKDGNPISFNGRSIEGKSFRLGKGVPRNEIIYNLHNAKKYGTAIVCESQFDVMRIYQAGFPNAVCFFGSHISKIQIKILQRFFERVIIMTDADSAGRKAGHTLSEMLRGVSVEWAIYDWGVVYPNDAKDAGDMTIEEIRYVIKNAVSDVSYLSYKPLHSV